MAVALVMTIIGTAAVVQSSIVKRSYSDQSVRGYLTEVG